MDCPQCQTTNPSEAVRCAKCDTPLGGNNAPITGTLTPTPTRSGMGSETLDSGAMEVPEGWSVPAPVPPSTAASLTSLQPGTLLGSRYEILKLLGQGGMGAVYQAKDRELDRIVALKVIRPELAGHPEILRRFKQELILARQVTHRNVIRIYDLGEVQGIKFITMEFIEGRDLRTLLAEKGKYAVEEAVGIMQQVCLALETAHSEGVVHRDLKPQNIMLDKQGRASVMDFGIARSVELGGMTQTGALMGTPEYMSPEQVRGELVDARSDLFTLGIIFYELLTGRMPYQAETALATMFKRTQQRAVPPAQLDLSVPKPVSDVVAKCLEIDPKLRYQSAREIRQDLETWLGTGTVFGARPPALASFPPVRWLLGLPISGKWIVAGVAVLVLAVSVFALRTLRVSFSSGTSSGTALEPVSLAILPFRNASGDPAMDWLGPSLAEMLRTDVGQSAALRTVPADRVHQILKDLRIPANADFDPDTRKRLAEFSNAQTLVWGQYVKVDDQIRIDATLQDLKHQRMIAVKTQVRNEKELLQAIGDLAQSIQQNLSLSADVLKALRARSFQPSSKSVRALRGYNEGLELARQGKHLEAMKSFEAATQEDPEFALAYSRLGLTYSTLGYDDKADQASRKAVSLSEKLPEQERYLIQANHAHILNDTAKAIESYENLAKVLPEDPEVHFNLGGLYESAGAFDKARAEYAKVLSTDPKQVDALLAAGRVEVRSGNPQGGLEYLNRALSLAIQLENDEEKAAVLQGIGVAYKLLNKLDEALGNYQESLAIKRRLGQKRGMGASLNEIAQIEVRLGKSEAALASFNEALQVRREIGDKKGIADTLNDLGNFYNDHGRYDQALKLLKESLQIERDVGDENGQALRLNNIGNSYLAVGDYDNGRTYFEQALRLREKFKVPRDIAQTLHNLAETSLRMGEYDQALTHYLRALELRRNSEDKRGVAMESFSLGTLFEYQGRYGAALTSKEEALKTFRDLQDRGFWMAAILSGYGRSLSQVGRYEEAQKSLEEALSLARELKNQALVAQTVNFQADSFFYRGDFKSARSLYEQALQEASRGNDRNVTLLSKINLAKVAVREERSQTAIGPLKALGQESDALGLKYLSTECSVYLGEALLNTRRYVSGRQELEAAIRKSEKLGLKELLAQSHYLLARTLQQTGNTAEAASHSREASRLLQEIRKEARSDGLLKREDLSRMSAESAGNS